MYSVDMIGHGLSDKPLDRDYEISTYVEHLLDLFDTLGFDRVMLSGESLGGWVVDHASWWGTRDRVDVLVLNTPGGLNAEPEVMERLKRMTLDAVSPPDPGEGPEARRVAVQGPLDESRPTSSRPGSASTPSPATGRRLRRSSASRRWRSASGTCFAPRT